MGTLLAVPIITLIYKGIGVLGTGDSGFRRKTRINAVPLSPLRSKGSSGLRYKDLKSHIGDRRCCPIAVPGPQNQCRRNVSHNQERGGNLATTASVDPVARRRAARPTAAVQSQRCGAAGRNFPTLQPVVRSDHDMPLSGWLWLTMQRRHAGHTEGHLRIPALPFPARFIIADPS